MHLFCLADDVCVTMRSRTQHQLCDYHLSSTGDGVLAMLENLDTTVVAPAMQNVLENGANYKLEKKVSA